MNFIVISNGPTYIVSPAYLIMMDLLQGIIAPEECHHLLTNIMDLLFPPPGKTRFSLARIAKVRSG